MIKYQWLMWCSFGKNFSKIDYTYLFWLREVIFFYFKNYHLVLEFFEPMNWQNYGIFEES